MTARAAVSVAKMQRMRRAIERDGLPFAGFRCLPDGSVMALVGQPLTAPTEAAPPSASSDDGFEAWMAKHGDG